MITKIEDKSLKKQIATMVLDDLKDWFGISKYRNAYIEHSQSLPFFAAYINHQPVGFVVLKKTSEVTGEIYCMGVIKKYHRNGLGKKLYKELEAFALKEGYKVMQVKTVEEGTYTLYDSTNRFYESLGFLKLEVLKTLWDEQNPCQLLVKPL